MSTSTKKNTKKIDAAQAQVNDLVDELSSPDAMSPEEALEFYDSVLCDLEAKANGVREDLRAREKRGG